MAGRAFVDTNVLQYLCDVREPVKGRVAEETLRSLKLGELVLSTQVLQEFVWNVTRKLDPPLPPEEAAQAVAELARNPVVTLDPPLILAAIARSSADGVAFWDALVVEAALSAGCTRLLTEDLQHGRRFGALVVENPFAGAA